MAWIESHQSLGTHRKLFDLMDALHMSDVALVGHLHFLWWWSLDNAPDGDITGISDKMLAMAAHWKGSPEKWAGALRKTGWLDEVDGHVWLHDWDDYAGRLIQQRGLTKEARKSGGQHRMASLTPEERSTLATQASNARWDASKHLASMPATVPNRTNPTVPNSTKEKQEKERMRFETFWKCYPRKQAKPEADRAFKKIAPNDDLLATILASVERFKASDDWLRDAGQYIPYPATYLNGHRWEDELQERGNGHKPIPSEDVALNESWEKH